MESTMYDQPDAFNLPEMRQAGITKNGFYNINELNDAINIYNTHGGEIMFIMKTDGTVIISPRRSTDILPHPYLAGGEDVISAGTIKPKGGKNLIIINKTGHYKTHFDDMTPIKNKLEGGSYGYNVKLQEHIPSK